MHQVHLRKNEQKQEKETKTFLLYDMNNRKKLKKKRKIHNGRKKEGMNARKRKEGKKEKERKLDIFRKEQK